MFRMVLQNCVLLALHSFPGGMAVDVCSCPCWSGGSLRRQGGRECYGGGQVGGGQGGGGQGGDARGGRGGRGWRGVGLVPPSSSSRPEKEIINHSDCNMCSKIIRKIIATFLKNILHSCKNR